MKQEKLLSIALAGALSEWANERERLKKDPNSKLYKEWEQEAHKNYDEIKQLYMEEIKK